MSIQKATMTDWVWVQAGVLQSMLGMLTPDIYAIVLSEEPDEWVLKLFTTAPLSEDIQDDLGQMTAEAEESLLQVHNERHPTETIVTTPAVVRPIRVQFVVQEDVPLIGSSERLLFAWRPPEE